MARHFDGGPERRGRIFERQVFSACEDTPEVRQLIAKYWTGNRAVTVGDHQVPHLTFEHAIAVAKAAQPKERTDRPERAAARIMRELRNAIIEELDERGILTITKGDTEIAAVRMYTGQTPVLDEVHGVDGFLEFTDPETQRAYRVTFDATINRAKIAGTQRASADVVISDLPDAVEESDAYYDALERIASAASERIEQQRSSHAA
ncbi:hypothetical protein HY480_04300 [Candidatus Uhrbacteria bacterium]|nr:hypothetical protein [Candidatus Uhrbacteria bacterium]